MRGAARDSILQDTKSEPDPMHIESTVTFKLLSPSSPEAAPEKNYGPERNDIFPRHHPLILFEWNRLPTFLFIES
jgi:hypothetical protein